MLLPKMQTIRNSSLFGLHSALMIALVGSLFLTGIILLNHTDEQWVVDSNFHFLFTFTANAILLFSVLVHTYGIIKSQLTVTWKYLLGGIGSIVIALLFSFLSGKLHIFIYGSQLLSDAISVNLIRDIVIAIIAILISLTLYNITRRQQLLLEKEKLETEKLMVRYEALEKQLDPHFLFNSLNTLSGLIGNDDDKAQTYLRQLASTYRYIMQSRRLVDLDEELQFVKSYCEMIKIRYGDNITFERHIDTRLLHHQIIPISIQLLIENALKHNIVSGRYPLTIILSTTEENTFRVSNMMRPKQEENNNTGLGLANLDKRYQLLCDKTITISDRDGIFAVEVPLLDPHEAAKIVDRLQIIKTT